MGEVGIRVIGLKGWVGDDGVIAFPPGDSSVDKLRTLWVLFCFMLRGRGYSHLKSVCGTARTVPAWHSAESRCWMDVWMNGWVHSVGAQCPG